MTNHWLAAAIVALTPAFALAASPRYTDIVVSDAKDGPPVSTFATNAPKVFLKAKLVDVPSGAKLRADWIAAKTKVVPENFKIDSTELPAGVLSNRADFSFSKPTAGWPVGEYRVDLFIDGKKAASAAFKVQ